MTSSFWGTIASTPFAGEDPSLDASYVSMTELKDNKKGLSYKPYKPSTL